jgi:hypothetical protein
LAYLLAGRWTLAIFGQLAGGGRRGRADAHLSPGLGRLAEISLPDSADCFIEPFGDDGRRERRRAR